MNHSEITKEFREKYFAAHWGQEIMSNHNWIGSSKGFLINVDPKVGRSDDWFIFLRPISAITDDEAIEVAKIGGVSYALDSSMATQGRLLLNEYLYSSRCNVRGADWMRICDYLRSIGIAIDFGGLSVNQLIEAGVLKIREGGET